MIFWLELSEKRQDNLKTYMILFQNPLSQLKKRNITFDLLKLFAALLVIMDHTLQRWIPNSQTTQLYNFIFLTQMPLFMFIAGFFAAKKIYRICTIRDFGIAVGKTTISLLIPFFSFSLVSSIFRACSSGHFLINYWTVLCFHRRTVCGFYGFCFGLN